jgi:tetratricopeptide (TPR) repeat protein
VSRGRRLEAQGKYDEARAQFRQAEAEAELKRLSDWLDHRAQWLTEAARLEAAGDQEQAHRLFGRANAKAEMQRTALVLGKKSEATKDYALAADYFEQGGDYVKAAAMRTLAEKESRGGRDAGIRGGGLPALRAGLRDGDGKRARWGAGSSWRRAATC